MEFQHHTSHLCMKLRGNLTPAQHAVCCVTPTATVLGTCKLQQHDEGMIRGSCPLRWVLLVGLLMHHPTCDWQLGCTAHHAVPVADRGMRKMVVAIDEHCMIFWLRLCKGNCLLLVDMHAILVVMVCAIGNRCKMHSAMNAQTMRTACRVNIALLVKACNGR